MNTWCRSSVRWSASFAEVAGVFVSIDQDRFALIATSDGMSIGLPLERQHSAIELVAAAGLRTPNALLEFLRRKPQTKDSLDNSLPTLIYSMPVVNQPMNERSTRDLFRGALEMMILESLRRQPAHGYALVQHIQQRSNNLLQVEEGSLYPALQRLLKAKLAKAEWGLSSTNRRVRTYQITAPGLRHLEKQISSFERMFEGITLVLSPDKSSA